MYYDQEREKLSLSDPDFWGVYGDEYVKKEATEKLNGWWNKEKDNLPFDIPKPNKIEKVMNSFDSALTKMNKVKSQSMGVVCEASEGVTVYVNPDTVYYLLGKHYGVHPKVVRDKFFEIT